MKETPSFKRAVEQTSPALASSNIGKDSAKSKLLLPYTVGNDIKSVFETL